MRHVFLASALCAATLFGTTPAAAGDPPALSSQQRIEAKRLFDKGMLAYRRGDYEESILRWQESYEISQHPLTFEAIANAHEKLGDYKSALDYLQRWREKAPRREHEVLDARIANYKRQLAKQEQAEAERLRLAEAARQRLAGEQKAQAEPAVAPLAIAGWVMVGTGGAAIITGVVLDIVASGNRPDVDDVCRDTGQKLLCADLQRDNIESSNTLAIVGDSLWIGGIAIAGTGALFLVLDALDEGSSAEGAGEDADADPAEVQPASTVSVAPVVGQDTLGIAVWGTF